MPQIPLARTTASLKLGDSLSGPEQSSVLNNIREELAGEAVDDDNDGKAETGFIGVNFAINTFLTERIEETISGFTASMVINIHGQDLDALDRDARGSSHITY